MKNKNRQTRRAFALSSIAVIAILATPGQVFGAAKAKQIWAGDRICAERTRGVRARFEQAEVLA